MEQTNSTPFETQNGFNPVENDREFKAHIYQQLTDLQPFLAADSQVAVMVQQEESADEENPEMEYALTLVTTFGEYRVESEGRDSNLYEAFSIAKRKMVDQLEEWYSAAIDNSERDAQIQSFIEGGYTVH